MGAIDSDLQGALSVGIYSTLVFVTQRLLWPLTRLGQTFELCQRAMASTRRIFELLDTPPTMHDGPRTLEPARVQGALRMEGVGFAYAGGPAVLNGPDLEMPAGWTTAVVGATGAGKSTLVKLMLRPYDPQEGLDTLDGLDLRELDRASLRGAIGLVSQDVYLFHGTVAENLRLSRPDASGRDLAEAAAAAEALEFIEEHPHGVGTVVGERGQRLSGGQRQRLSTVRHADLIHVLNRGTLVESGRHEALVERGGVDAARWRVQTGVREAVDDSTLGA